MITRGLGSGSLITRGLAGSTDFILREIIRGVSKICSLISGTSEIDRTISGTSEIDQAITLTSKIDLEEDLDG